MLSHFFSVSRYSIKDCLNLSPQGGTFVLAIYHLRMGILSGRVRLCSHDFFARNTVRIKSFDMESFALDGDDANKCRFAAIDVCRSSSNVKRTKNRFASELFPFIRM